MKKAVLILFLFLLLVPLTLAQNPDDTTPPLPGDVLSTLPDPDNPTLDPRDPEATITDGSINQEVTSAGDTIEVARTTSETYVNKPLPEAYIPLAKTIFQLKEPISLSQAIIAVMVTLLFMIMMVEAMQFSFFSEKTAIAVGVILGVILTLTGATRSFTYLLLNFGGNLSFLESWGAGAVLFAVVIVIVLGVVFFKIGKYFKIKKTIETSYERGAKAGAQYAYTDAMQRSMAKVSKTASKK